MRLNAQTDRAWTSFLLYLQRIVGITDDLKRAMRTPRKPEPPKPAPVTGTPATPAKPPEPAAKFTVAPDNVSDDEQDVSDDEQDEEHDDETGGPLKFKVAPHIFEDLGLNLYTSLPRVLAEFVANAYDADSPSADITIDHEKIVQARQRMREAHKAAQKRAEKEGYQIDALATQTLPADISIVISDAGCGMSRHDLQKKFLVAGRRRRKEDKLSRTEKKQRLIMGRKGLGKLAGFGVAKRVEVVTRKEGEQHATKITLVYDDLVAEATTEDIDVNEEILLDGGGFAVSGTRVVLSDLLYDPTKSQIGTISSEVSEHFEMIRQEDFAIRINGNLVEPLVREFAFAWPSPNEAGLKELVDSTYTTEDGLVVPFRYRMRFTMPEKALPGQRRGVRIYARGRLAAAPSLLDADTNMHGWRMTDYLDGVVEADSLDEHATDFIATDRQSLRWESPLLAPLKVMLGDAITEACKEYQKKRDGVTPGIVKNDEFTLKAIKKQGLEGRDRTLAIRIGTSLAGACKRGVGDPEYRTKFPEILRGIGHGNLLTSIAKLAAEERPELHRVAAKLVELTHEELDGFASIARGRVNAIGALRKIVKDADFKNKKDEKKVQKLFEQAPWMVDSTFGYTVSADEGLGTLFDRLATELEIGNHSTDGAENTSDRPDLVFFLGRPAANKLVIVELKAANVSLESAHLDQLLDYMKRSREWLAVNSKSTSFVVHGHLIGMINTDSRTRGHRALMERMREGGPEAKWRVRTLLEVLDDAEHAHEEMLATNAAAEERDDNVGGDDE